MSTALFPSLAGQGWSIVRTPTWKTRKQEAISGKETAIADWSQPRYQWDLTFNVLREGTGFYLPADTWTEFSTLFGFFNSRQGGFDSFLYQDQDDHQIFNQSLGVGDGTTATFQLVRSFGGFTEDVLAPNGTASYSFLAGTAVLTVSALNLWGSTTPGTVTFTRAPANGSSVTGSFSYFWPCRFVVDKCEFEKFAYGPKGTGARYAVKKLSFMSIK